MKNKEYSLYGLFDLLKPNMNYNEIREFIDYMVNLKLVENNMQRKIKCIPVIIGKRCGRMMFSNVDDETLEDPFIFKNKLFIPSSDINSAIAGNHMGQLISHIGHELEHIYQQFKHMNDKHPYDEHMSFELPEDLQKSIELRLGKDDLEFITTFAQQVNYLTYIKLYSTSQMEFQANSIATIYYGYNLYKYAKQEPNETRRNFLFDQVKEIIEEQVVMNEMLACNIQNVHGKIDEGLYVGLLDVLKLGDYHKDYKRLVKELYGMCKKLDIDKGFMKEYKHLINEKYGKVCISERSKFQNFERANALIETYTNQVIRDNQTKAVQRMNSDERVWNAELPKDIDARIDEQVEEIFSSLE